MALARDSAKLQNLSAAERDQLYSNLLTERWHMWTETLVVFLATGAAGLLAAVRWKYWPAVALVLSTYVVWVAGTPLIESSGWQTLRHFMAMWPKSVGAIWYSYLVPLLYLVLAGTAIVAVLARRRETA